MPKFKRVQICDGETGKKFDSFPMNKGDTVELTETFDYAPAGYGWVPGVAKIDLFFEQEITLKIKDNTLIITKGPHLGRGRLMHLLGELMELREERQIRLTREAK